MAMDTLKIGLYDNNQNQKKLNGNSQTQKEAK